MSITSAERPVALVTGSAKRVGAVVARWLGKAGYRLAVHANRSIEEARALADELSRGGTESRARAAHLCGAAGV